MLMINETVIIYIIYGTKLSANMMNEAFLGFNAFNTKKITGKDVIDFVRYRQLIAEGHPIDEELFEEVLGKPI